MNTKRYCLIFLIILLCCAVASASTFQDTFPGTTLNSTFYNNRSRLTPNASLYVDSNSAIFTGNDSGATGIQRNAGVYFNSKDSINSTYSGSLRFTLTLSQINDGCVGAWGLMPQGWSAGGAGGAWLELQSNRRLDIVNGASPTLSNYTTIDSNDSIPHTYQINVYRIGTQTFFSFFRDGVLIKVVDQTIQAKLYANFSGGAHSADYFTYSVSNLYWINGNDTTAVSLPLGSYCGNDPSVCQSGYCEYTKCALKVSNMVCSQDSECISGDCDLTGHCTDPGLVDSVTAAKNTLFGSDSDTSNLISLVAILGIGTFLVAAGLTAGSVVVGLGAGVSWIVLTTLFFTMIGWLSPFFLIGLVLIALILFAYASIVGAGGGVN